MNKAAFDQISEGLNEALLVARDKSAPYKLHLPAEPDATAIDTKTSTPEFITTPVSPRRRTEPSC